ncbi:hypothetical protein BJ944DRAFT_274238 [Cunninghamella echinulata]|nr:hypothetical protein BJ944DRAFT_274238 [Cunninghamella echinulata]
MNPSNNQLGTSEYFNIGTGYDSLVQNMNETWNGFDPLDFLVNTSNIQNPNNEITNININDGDVGMINTTITNELLVWFNQDYTIHDHLKFMIQNNFKTFIDHCILELDYKWKKENLLDNVIIPDAITYLHQILKKPNTLSQKKKYYGKRRKLLEELFQDLGYQDFKYEIIKRVNAKDPWTGKDGGPSHSWWDDVMKWIRLDRFKY